jgi:hypothetical protein
MAVPAACNAVSGASWVECELKVGMQSANMSEPTARLPLFALKMSVMPAMFSIGLVGCD